MPRLLALFLCSTSALAAPNGKVPVQGFLTDGSDVPIDSALPTIFRLYGDGAATPGSELWSGTQTITYDQGEFSAHLGESAALDLALFEANPTVWMTMEINGSSVLGPFEVGAVPTSGFAHSAGDAATLDGSTAADFLPVSYAPPWTALTDVPADLLDGDDVLSQAAVEGFATAVCFDTEAELLAVLDDDYLTQANYTADQATLMAAVSANAADIAALQADLGTTNGDVATNAGDIATLQSDVATTNGDVATNSGDIATLQSDLGTTTGDVSTNAADIASLQSGLTTTDGDVATNAGDIASLQSGLTSTDADVASNAADIAAVQSDLVTTDGDVATNAGDIAALQSDLATTDGNVSANASDISTLQSDVSANTTGVGDNASDITANTSAINSNAAAISTVDEIRWMIQHGAAAGACAAYAPVGVSPISRGVFPHEAGVTCTTTCATNAGTRNQCLTSIAIGSIRTTKATAYTDLLATNYNYGCNDSQASYDEVLGQGLNSSYTAYCCCYR